MFKRKYTKWIPLYIFIHSFEEYIILAKRNVKTGDIVFKTKRVNTRTRGILTQIYEAKHCFLDFEKQFNKLLTAD